MVFSTHLFVYYFLPLGAHAARQELARELAADAGRLAGVRVVVYEFAAREMSFGDWKEIELP